MSRVQTGYLYEASGAFFVRYTGEVSIVDGKEKRVQRSQRLCDKSEKYYALDAKAVKLLRDEFMLTVNQQERTSSRNRDMKVVDYWDQIYLPYCEEVVKLTGQPRKKPSTLRGYKQIWKQRLKAHSGN
jgi:hypothetical protein